MSKQYLQNVPGLIYTDEEIPLAPPEQQQALVKKSLLEMPSATARGLLKIPGYATDLPGLGLHYLSTGLSSLLPEEANQALGIRSFQKSMLDPAFGSQQIGRGLERIGLPPPETPVGKATEFLAEIAPLPYEALTGALVRKFGSEFPSYLAKKITAIQQGLERPDDLTGFEALLLQDPRLFNAIVVGHGKGPSALLGDTIKTKPVTTTSPTVGDVDTSGQPIQISQEGGVLDESGTPLNELAPEDLPSEYQNPVFISPAKEKIGNIIPQIRKIKGVTERPASEWLSEGVKTDNDGNPVLKDGKPQIVLKGLLGEKIEGQASGISPKEIRKIGLLDEVEKLGDKKITADELENFINDFYGGIELKETVLSNMPRGAVDNPSNVSEAEAFREWYENEDTSELTNWLYDSVYNYDNEFPSERFRPYYSEEITAPDLAVHYGVDLENQTYILENPNIEQQEMFPPEDLRDFQQIATDEAIEKYQQRAGEALRERNRLASEPFTEGINEQRRFQEGLLDLNRNLQLQAKEVRAKETADDTYVKRPNFISTPIRGQVHLKADESNFKEVQERIEKLKLKGYREIETIEHWKDDLRTQMQEDRGFHEYLGRDAVTGTSSVGLSEGNRKLIDEFLADETQLYEVRNENDFDSVAPTHDTDMMSFSEDNSYEVMDQYNDDVMSQEINNMDYDELRRHATEMYLQDGEDLPWRTNLLEDTPEDYDAPEVEELGYKGEPEAGFVTLSGTHGYNHSETPYNYKEIMFSLGPRSVLPEYRRHLSHLLRKYRPQLESFPTEYTSRVEKRYIRSDDPKGNLYNQILEDKAGEDFNFHEQDISSVYMPLKFKNLLKPDELEKHNRLLNNLKEMLPHQRKSSFGHLFGNRDMTNFRPVWVRFSERVDQNGNRVAFIEEIQSDWFQGLQSKGALDIGDPAGSKFKTANINLVKEAGEQVGDLLNIYRDIKFGKGHTPENIQGRYEVKLLPTASWGSGPKDISFNTLEEADAWRKKTLDDLEGIWERRSQETDTRYITTALEDQSYLKRQEANRYGDASEDAIQLYNEGIKPQNFDNNFRLYDLYKDPTRPIHNNKVLDRVEVARKDPTVSFSEMIKQAEESDKAEALNQDIFSEIGDADKTLRGLGVLDPSAVAFPRDKIAGDKYFDDFFDEIHKEFKSSGNLSEDPDYLRALEIIDDLRGKRKKYSTNVSAKEGGAPYPHFLGKETQDWVGLGLKRVLRWASDQGFDRVAWPSSPLTLRIQANQANPVRGVEIQHLPDKTEDFGGPVARLNFVQQLESEDISKPLALREGVESSLRKSIETGTPLARHAFVDVLSGRIIPHTQGDYLDSKIGEDYLDQIVGKQDAKRILESAKKAFKSNKETRLELKSTPFSQMTLGRGGKTGEVYKTIYDKILPNLAKKMAKKWKSKVGRTHINESNEGVFGLSENIAEIMAMPEEQRRKLLVDVSEHVGVGTKGTENVLVNYLDLTPKAKKKIREGLSLLD